MAVSGQLHAPGIFILQVKSTGPSGWDCKQCGQQKVILFLQGIQIPFLGLPTRKLVRVLLSYCGS